MKNISLIILSTVLTLLIITVFFSIAELNLVAKSDYTNHLEQTVVMCASYLLLCKLVIQIAITYIVAHILHSSIKRSNINRRSRVAKLRADYANAVAKAQEVNKSCIERDSLIEKFKTIRSNPLTPDEAFKPNTEHNVPKELKLEDVIDNDSFVPKGTDVQRLDIIIGGALHSFEEEDISENKCWRCVGHSNNGVMLNGKETNRWVERDNRYYFEVVE